MTALAELTSKLKEIFQIDRADLDFFWHLSHFKQP